MLMQLTDLEGRPVGVDPETVYIAQTEGVEPDSPIPVTWIGCGDHGSVAVRETVEEVIAKVNSFTKGEQNA